MNQISGHNHLASTGAMVSERLPPGQLSGFGRRLYGSRVSCAIVALVFAAAALSACSGTSDKNPTEASVRSTNPSPVAPTAQESVAPDTSVVRVVDFGFSTFTSGAGESVCSYGVLVENGSSRYTADAILVRIRMFSTDGGEVLVEPSDHSIGTGGVHRISAALPGGMAAESGTFVVSGAMPVRMTAEFVKAAWYPKGTSAIIPSTTIHDYRPLTASNITVDRRQAQQAPQVISFTVDSQYDQGLPRCEVLAVLRDSAGRIVGGTASNDAQLSTIASGRSTGSIVTRPGYLPPTADDSRTEVYLMTRA